VHRARQRCKLSKSIAAKLKHLELARRSFKSETANFMAAGAGRKLGFRVVPDTKLLADLADVLQESCRYSLRHQKAWSVLTSSKRAAHEACCVTMPYSTFAKRLSARLCVQRACARQDVCEYCAMYDNTLGPASLLYLRWVDSSCAELSADLVLNFRAWADAHPRFGAVAFVERASVDYMEAQLNNFEAQVDAWEEGHANIVEIRAFLAEMRTKLSAADSFVPGLRGLVSHLGLARQPAGCLPRPSCESSARHRVHPQRFCRTGLSCPSRHGNM
jgi:hypothetical protein